MREEIQNVVWGNSNDTSTAGLIFARNIDTGEKNVYFGSVKIPSLEMEDITEILHWGSKMPLSSFKRLIEEAERWEGRSNK